LEYVDLYGESAISVLVKKAAKLGIKKAIKEYVEKKIKKKLKKNLSPKELKDFASELMDIIDTLDSEWWEFC